MNTKYTHKPSSMRNIVLLLLFFTGMVKAQIVNIPDANFKAALIADGIDTNGDGEIQTVEAFVVNQLHVDHANISNLIGLSSFVNVTSLYCENNAITFLDLSGNPNINYIKCSYNQLSFLNVSGNPGLTDLLTDHNNLNGINISNNPNLTDLWVFNNNLATLNLSSCTNLRVLSCSDNALTSLDLSSNLNLSDLKCSNNQLSALNVTGLTNLQTLECYNNQLTTIDVSSLSGLVSLYVGFNQLTSVNVSNLINLKSLDCQSNQVSSIDMTGITNLFILHCENNQLTTLDLSGNTRSNLFVDCSNNNLSTLFMKNGWNATLVTSGPYCQCSRNIYFFNNPNLTYVCADPGEMADIQALSGTGNYSNFTVNSYCDYVPGGNYNTITGNVKFDLDNNGCDAADINPKNIRLNINDGTNTAAAFTDQNGNYTFYTQVGNFDIEPVIENPTWFTFSPNNATIPFADNNNNSTTQNFCITSNGSHQDLEIVLVPIGPARPGFDAVYELVLHNKGNQFMNDWTGVLLQYDALKMSFVSSSIVNSSSVVGVLEWGYFLAPFQTQTIEVVFHINSPVDVHPVVNGDVLNFTAVFNPISTDENQADNTFVYHQTVVGSYDPNDIICLEGDVVPPTEIGNYLHYVINFENTGTYPAENVVVKTEVDTSKFEINSLQLMNTNFPVDARITGNKAEFIFKNIQLPIGGHGHILLKIKTKNILVTGSSVSNRGDIFFDYNAPVDTGLATTFFQTLSNTGFATDSSVTITPNPASEFVFVRANSLIQSVEVYDTLGRIIQTIIINKNESKLNINSYSSGTYFIKIVTEKGAKVQKLLKE